MLISTLMFGLAVSAQNGNTIYSGLGVFGRVLGIHAQDTLVMTGDLFIRQATIVGTGTLSLRSHKPQRIISSHSSMQQLHVSSTTVVIVRGELHIEKALTVDSGLLDVRTTKLTLGDSAHIKLHEGAHIQYVSMLTGQTCSNSSNELKCSLEATWLTSIDFLSLVYRTPDTVFSERRRAWSVDIVKQPSPPPESV